MLKEAAVASSDVQARYMSHWTEKKRENSRPTTIFSLRGKILTAEYEAGLLPIQRRR